MADSSRLQDTYRHHPVAGPLQQALLNEQLLHKSLLGIYTFYDQKCSILISFASPIRSHFP